MRGAITARPTGTRPPRGLDRRTRRQNRVRGCCGRRFSRGGVGMRSWADSGRPVRGHGGHYSGGSGRVPPRRLKKARPGWESPRVGARREEPRFEGATDRSRGQSPPKGGCDKRRGGRRGRRVNGSPAAGGLTTGGGGGRGLPARTRRYPWWAVQPLPFSEVAPFWMARTSIRARLCSSSGLAMWAKRW